jgi:hypothetical protein
VIAVTDEEGSAGVPDRCLGGRPETDLRADPERIARRDGDDRLQRRGL